MTGPIYYYIYKNQRYLTNYCISTLEEDIKTFNPLANPQIIQELTFQMQGTQFVKMAGAGDGRVYANTAPSAIDEETLASVVAYATFDDVGGSFTPILISSGATVTLSFTSASYTALSFGTGFTTPEFKIPLLDGEGRVAYYRGHVSYLNWSPYLAPEVAHQNQFLMGHSLELNVPGTNTNDQSTFVYYDSHPNFNVSNSISMSLWVYPTDLSNLGATGARYLCYRYIDASNYWILFIDSAASNQIKIFLNEAGALTKIRTSINDALNLNAWNLVNFTYNPSTNALVLYVNGTAYTTTSTSTETPNYTTDANMYLGGIPGVVTNRFTGYMDNFVFWSGKILSASEVTNMWTRGTII